jgi:hypothetical protein
MKSWARIVLPFSIFFVIGISSAYYFISTEKLSDKQVSVVKEKKSYSSTPIYNCTSKAEIINDLRKEVNKSIKWLNNNENAPKKQKLEKRKKIQLLENQIISFLNSERTEKDYLKVESIGQNLVIRRKCY